MIRLLSARAFSSVLAALACAAAAGAQPAPAAARAQPATIEAKTAGMQKLDGLLPVYWDEAEGKLYRRPGNFDIKVTSGVDWFELHAQVDFDGQSASLPELLAALKRGENYVQLDDGSEVRVELSRERHAELEPRVGESLYVSPKDLKVFHDPAQRV